MHLQTELKALMVSLNEKGVGYALCGAMALSVFGCARATYDIDLLALGGNPAAVRDVARRLGFTLDAIPMYFVGGTVRIDRVTKTDPLSADFLSVDILSLAPELERGVQIEQVQWNGIDLRIVSRESLIRLKELRGNPQDRADIDRLRS
jgi:hypothetical protein